MTNQQPPKDRIYADERPRIDDFNFGKETAQVFDDMLGRSVPFYPAIQDQTVQLAADFAKPGTGVWDLGCSTATTLIALHRALPPEVDLVGVDNSADMLAQARSKLDASGVGRPVDLVLADLNEGVEVANASAVLLVLTLQFVRPLNRERLLKQVREGLADDGCLVLVEKVLGETPLFNRQFIKHYHEYKERNGYSRLEIAQKREALENVLIPYRVAENREMLRRCGFNQFDVFFKWYNFCGMVSSP